MPIESRILTSSLRLNLHSDSIGRWKKPHTKSMQVWLNGTLLEVHSNFLHVLCTTISSSLQPSGMHSCSTIFSSTVQLSFSHLPSTAFSFASHFRGSHLWSMILSSGMQTTSMQMFFWHC